MNCAVRDVKIEGVNFGCILLFQVPRRDWGGVDINNIDIPILPLIEV